MSVAMAEGAKSGAKGSTAVKSEPAAASPLEPIDVEPVMSGIFAQAHLCYCNLVGFFFFFFP